MVSLLTFFCGCMAHVADSEKIENPNLQKQPNVIVILTDDQGYGDLGCYGSRIKTPNIDRMAVDGMRFTDFYAGANVSTPSRAALLTGCYPARVNMPNVLFPKDSVCISSAELTLAEMFKSVGYHTGIVGKWHLGAKNEGLPLQHGFDEFYGLPYSHGMVPDAFKGFINDPSKKLDADYPPMPLYLNDKEIELNPDPATFTTRYTDYCVDFIDKNKDNPFFLYLAHNMPHVPLAVSEERKGKSGVGLYGDVITEIDWSIGRIQEALSKNGLEKNTLIIYLSDNGPWLSYGNHGGNAGNLREGKGTTFDGGHRVCCVMKWPEVIPAGRVCSEVATTMDILPTMAHYIGARLSENKIDGEDIISLMHAEKNAVSPHEAYYYFKGRNLFAVRWGDWKLILPHHEAKIIKYGKDGLRGVQKTVFVEKALYNLREEPSESKNLLQKYPRKVAKMERMINVFAEDVKKHDRPCGVIKVE